MTDHVIEGEYTVRDASAEPEPRPIPLIERPICLDLTSGGGFGAAPDGRCSPITAAILGGLAVYVIPPLLGGLFDGIRQGWRER